MDADGADAQVDAGCAGELRNRLSRLDGEQRCPIICAWLLDEIEFPDLDLDDFPAEYIECAGSFDVSWCARSARMAIVRARPRARRVAADDRRVAVHRNGCETVVRPHQVLTGPEVVEHLVSYVHDGTESQL